MAPAVTGGVVAVGVAGAVLIGGVLVTGGAGVVLGAGVVTGDDAGVVGLGRVGGTDGTEELLTGGVGEIDVTGAVVVVGVVEPVGDVQTSSSDSPMLAVPALTELTLNRTLLVERELNVTVWAVPALLSAGTVTNVPSANVSRPAVTRSSEFGRS